MQRDQQHRPERLGAALLAARATICFRAGGRTYALRALYPDDYLDLNRSSKWHNSTEKHKEDECNIRSTVHACASSMRDAMFV